MLDRGDGLLPARISFEGRMRINQHNIPGFQLDWRFSPELKPDFTGIQAEEIEMRPAGWTDVMTGIEGAKAVQMESVHGTRGMRK